MLDKTEVVRRSRSPRVNETAVSVSVSKALPREGTGYRWRYRSDPFFRHSFAHQRSFSVLQWRRNEAIDENCLIFAIIAICGAVKHLVPSTGTPVCTGTCRSHPDEQAAQVDEFSPSVKLVYKTLEYEGPLTQKQLVEQTQLARSTVSEAVTRLERVGLVEERFLASDARQRLYVLAEEP